LITLYITRHGETLWNQEKRMQGHKNSPLTDLGIKQAKWLANRMKFISVQKIYSSPIERAYETAKIIQEVVEAPLEAIDNLKEMFLGSWEGELVSTIETQETEKNYLFWNEPQRYYDDEKEDFYEVRLRAGEIVDNILSEHEGETLLLVGHAIIVKGLINYLLDEPIENFWKTPHIHPTSLTKVILEDDKATFEYIADTSHHEEAMTQGWFLEELF
jgi:phosphoserine phosphatase